MPASECLVLEAPAEVGVERLGPLVEVTGRLLGAPGAAVADDEVRRRVAGARAGRRQEVRGDARALRVGEHRDLRAEPADRVDARLRGGRRTGSSMPAYSGSSASAPGTSTTRVAE